MIILNDTNENFLPYIKERAKGTDVEEKNALGILIIFPKGKHKRNTDKARAKIKQNKTKGNLQRQSDAMQCKEEFQGRTRSPKRTQNSKRRKIFM